MCCSVLQYFTLYCSVLQCVALCSQQSARCPNFVYIIGLQSAAVRCYELQCVAVRCRVLNNQLATQLPVERSNAAVHLTHGPMSTIISIRCKQFLTVENTLQHTATHCNILQHTATRCCCDCLHISGYDVKQLFIGSEGESCGTHGFVMWHTWIRHVAHMDSSCRTHECVMSHTWIRHVAHMNVLCRTREGVASHT